MNGTNRNIIIALSLLIVGIVVLLLFAGGLWLQQHERH